MRIIKLFKIHLLYTLLSLKFIQNYDHIIINFTINYVIKSQFYYVKLQHKKIVRTMSIHLSSIRKNKLSNYYFLHVL